MKTIKYKGFIIEKAARCYRVRGIRSGYDPAVGGADWERFPSLKKAQAFIDRVNA